MSQVVHPLNLANLLLNIQSPLFCISHSPFQPEHYRALDLVDNPEHRAKRALHDLHHAEQIKRIWKESLGRYGVRKVWQKLKREGYVIARCTVARLMQKLGIQGVWRGKNKQIEMSYTDISKSSTGFKFRSLIAVFCARLLGIF